MNKANIRKWCRALRSKKYSQTRYNLQDPNGYCCLGVACKVFIPEEKQEFFKDNKCLRGATPIAQSASPLWLTNINADFDITSKRSLSVLNDHDELTFDEIADCLEAVYIHEALS